MSYFHAFFPGGIHDVAAAILFVIVLLDEWQRFQERQRTSGGKTP